MFTIEVEDKLVYVYILCLSNKIRFLKTLKINDFFKYAKFFVCFCFTVNTKRKCKQFK